MIYNNTYGDDNNDDVCKNNIRKITIQGRRRRKCRWWKEHQRQSPLNVKIKISLPTTILFVLLQILIQLRYHDALNVPTTTILSPYRQQQLLLHQRRQHKNKQIGLSLCKTVSTTTCNTATLFVYNSNLINYEINNRRCYQSLLFLSSSSSSDDHHQQQQQSQEQKQQSKKRLQKSKQDKQKRMKSSSSSSSSTKSSQSSLNLNSSNKSTSGNNQRRQSKVTLDRQQKRRQSASRQSPTYIYRNNNSSNNRGMRNAMSQSRLKGKQQQQQRQQAKSINYAAISFNKWLTNFLRHEGGTADEAKTILLERVESQMEKVQTKKQNNIKYKDYSSSNNNSSGDVTNLKNNSTNFDNSSTSSYASSSSDLYDFDTISFNLVLNAYGKERSMNAARNADSLLQVLLSLSPTLQADTYSYSAVLNAYAKSNGKRTAALRAEELIKQMLLEGIGGGGGKFDNNIDSSNPSRSGRRSTSRRITDICHNAVMDCWAVSGDSDAGRRAQVWLSRLEDEQIGPPYPTRISYNICLKAWARTNTKYGAIQAHSILQKMKKLSETVNPELAPDKISYSICMDAYCRIITGGSGSITAAAATTTNIRPKTTTANHLLTFKNDTNTTNNNEKYREDGNNSSSIRRGENINNNDSSIDQQERTFYGDENNLYLWAAQQAEDLLQQMEKYAREEDDDENSSSSSSSSSIRPDVVSYTSLLCAYAKAGIDYKRAMTLIDRMEKYANQKPNTNFLNTLITVFAKHSKVTHAESLFKSMSHRNMTDKITYTALISAHAAAAPSATTKITTTTELLSSSSSSSSNNLRSKNNGNNGDDNTTTDNPAAATTTTSTPNGTDQKNDYHVIRAKELLDELEGLYRSTRQEKYLPNVQTFSAVVNAISKSKKITESTLNEIDSLLQRMDGLYQLSNKTELMPNTVLYSQVLQILSKYDHYYYYNYDNHNHGDALNPQIKQQRSNNSMTSTRTAAMRATELVEEMKRQQFQNPQVRPDASTYAYLINTYTKSRVRNAAELATNILKDVEDGYKAGDDNLKPTKLLYSAVLQAYAKSASKSGAELAEQLLQRTKQLYRQEGKIYAKPTALYYNAVMDAHARSNGGRDAALRAEDLLTELETRCKAGDSELIPKTRSYNAVILAWKNSNETDSPMQAEALLKRMNERYKNGDDGCRPDRVTINSIIGVWAKSRLPDAAKRAEKFLNFMEQLYSDVGDITLKPDSYSFNSVINAYARSASYSTVQADKNKAAQKADELYRRMKSMYEDHNDLDVRPDYITYTSLQNVWAKSNDPEARKKSQYIEAMLRNQRNLKQKQQSSQRPSRSWKKRRHKKNSSSS